MLNSSRIHQVNSISNEMKQNIAVNIWLKHTEGHRPTACKLSPDEATLDKYHFSELEKSQAEIDGRAPPEPTPRYISQLYWIYIYSKPTQAYQKIFQQPKFCTWFIIRQSVTQTRMTRGAPRYPRQGPGVIEKISNFCVWSICNIRHLKGY